MIPDARTDEEVAALCERIRERVENARFDAEAVQVKVTASLGWTRMEAEGRGPYDFVRSADRALYRAKESGRNRVAGPGEGEGRVS